MFHVARPCLENNSEPSICFGLSEVCLTMNRKNIVMVKKLLPETKVLFLRPKTSQISDCIVLYFWFSGIMNCMFIFEKGVPLMR